MQRRRSETKEKKEKRGESRSWSGGGRSRPKMSRTGYDTMSLKLSVPCETQVHETTQSLPRLR